MSVEPGLQHQHVQNTKVSAENMKTDQVVIAQPMSVLPLEKTRYVRVPLQRVYVPNNTVSKDHGLGDVENTLLDV